MLSSARLGCGGSIISDSIEERIATLRVRHRELDQIILEEQGRPWPDDPLIKNLKRQKLRIKDRIAAMEIGPKQRFEV